MERVIVKDLKREMKAHKEKLMQSHRVKRRLDTMQEAAAKLVREACLHGHAGSMAHAFAGGATPLPAPCLAGQNLRGRGWSPQRRNFSISQQGQPFWRIL